MFGLSSCPTPFKLRFETRWEAREAAIQIAKRLADKRKSGRGKGKTVSRRTPAVYECSCGGYHLMTKKGSQLTQT